MPIHAWLPVVAAFCLLIQALFPATALAGDSDLAESIEKLRNFQNAIEKKEGFDKSGYRSGFEKARVAKYAECIFVSDVVEDAVRDGRDNMVTIGLYYMMRSGCEPDVLRQALGLPNELYFDETSDAAKTEPEKRAFSIGRSLNEEEKAIEKEAERKNTEEFFLQIGRLKDR